MHLYDYTNQYQKALVELDDLDLPDNVVEDTLNALVGDFEEKTKNVVAYMRNLAVDVDAMKNAEKLIKERRQRVERRVQWTNNYILTNMLINNITSITCPYFSIKTRKNPHAVNITSTDDIPDQYITEEMVLKIDKKKIKEDLLAGREVAGAEVTQGWRLDIK